MALCGLFHLHIIAFDPNMENGRCRMHGGTNPGAPIGKANGADNHGRYTCEAIAMRRAIAALRRYARETIQAIE